MSEHPRQQQVGARRRVMVRIGFAALVVVSATACIFEKSDYQGGGRLDKGATAQTATASSSASASTTPTSTADATPPNPFLDAAGGG